MLGLVGAGMGVAMVPTAAQKLLMHDVVFRKLSPAPKSLAELHMVWKRNHDNPAFRVFRDLVLDKLADL
jgi:DNA-binding transcriptional LysR family regulator